MKRISFFSYAVTILISSGVLLPLQTIPVHAEESAKQYVVTLPEVEEKEELPSAIYGDGERSLLARDRWLFFGNISAAYLRSDQTGGNSLSGGDVNGVLASGYRLTERLLASIMYNGEYYKKRDYYSDQVGPRLRTEHQSHTITPMLRYHFGKGDRYSIRPSFFYTRTYNRDVAGGGWHDGLYNYKDTGAGLDFDMRLHATDLSSGIFRCGLQYYQRKYPNFHSLLDLATGLGIEKDERDYQGLHFRTSYTSGKESDLRWALEYYFLYKWLDDKKVVESDGVLSATEEKDFLQSLTLRLSYFLPQQTNLRLGLDLNTSLNNSNQNYYDGMGTISLADDVYMNDYYDYWSYQIRPNFSYNFSDLPLSLHLAYAWQRTDFTDRLAQNREGYYKNDKQYEDQHLFTTRLEYLIFKRTVAFAQWDYLDVSSNNQNEHIYHYSHQVKTWQLGVSYTF